MSRHIDELSASMMGRITARNTFFISNSLNLYSKTPFRGYLGSGYCPYNIYKAEVEKLSRIPIYSFRHGTPNTNSELVHNYVSHNSDTVARALCHKLGTYEHARKVAPFVNSTLMGKAILAPFLLTNLLGHSTDEEIKQRLDYEVEEVSKLPEHLFAAIRLGGAIKGTYNSLYRKLILSDTNTFTSMQFKKFCLEVTNGAIVDFTSGRVIMMITLNPDYLDYFLLHRYTRDSSDLFEEIFTIAVDRELWETNGKSYTKELWQLVKKGVIQKTNPKIKGELVDGVELFNELYSNHINKPEPPLGPLEQIAENAVLQTEFIEQENVTRILTSRNIYIH